jgi:hypothetical protein
MYSSASSQFTIPPDDLLLAVLILETLLVVPEPWMFLRFANSTDGSAVFAYWFVSWKPGLVTNVPAFPVTT